MNAKHTPGPHSHKTIGNQVKELVAERDRLKEVSAELLAALEDAHNELDILCSNIRAAIAKATGGNK